MVIPKDVKPSFTVGLTPDGRVTAGKNTNKPSKIGNNEVYERILALENKVDFLDRENRRLDYKFSMAILIIVMLEVLNIIVHLFVKTRGMV